MIKDRRSGIDRRQRQRRKYKAVDLWKTNVWCRGLYIPLNHCLHCDKAATDCPEPVHPYLANVAYQGLI